MVFWTYNQNNSGGEYIKNEDIAEFVIIEADDYREANTRAKMIGLNPDAAYCKCCGKRWSPMNSHDTPNGVPKIYDRKVEDYVSWKPDSHAIIHYKDGRKEKIELKYNAYG